MSMPSWPALRGTPTSANMSSDQGRRTRGHRRPATAFGVLWSPPSLASPKAPKHRRGCACGGVCVSVPHSSLPGLCWRTAPSVPALPVHLPRRGRIGVGLRALLKDGPLAPPARMARPCGARRGMGAPRAAACGWGSADKRPSRQGVAAGGWCLFANAQHTGWGAGSARQGAVVLRDGSGVKRR